MRKLHTIVAVCVACAALTAQAPGPCAFSLTLTQDGPGAALVVHNSCGQWNNLYVNLVSFVAVDFPNGPMYGIDLRPAEAISQVAMGPPFFGVLGRNGSATTILAPPLPLPAGIVVYCVGIEINGMIDTAIPEIVSVTQPIRYKIQ